MHPSNRHNANTNLFDWIVCYAKIKLYFVSFILNYLSVVTFVSVYMQESSIESFRIADVVGFSVADLSF